MPAVSRLGDLTTGHGPFPPTPSIAASPNVNANGLGVVRVGDAFQIHCDPTPTCHQGTLAAGSGTVFVNGVAAGRIGDTLTDGDAIAQGSPNVFAGG